MEQTIHKNEFNIYYGGISNPKPTGIINVEKLCDMIKSYTFKGNCDAIRAIQCDDITLLKRERNKLKRRLPYVTPGGLFSYRKKKGLVAASGLAPIDIDYPDSLDIVRGQLAKDPYVHLMFISPSGEGIKLLIKVPSDPEKYESYVCGFYDYLSKEYGMPTVTLDRATRDISRACYLSHDPDVIFNDDSVVFEIEGKPSTRGNKDTSRSATEYREIIKLLFAGRSRDYIFSHMQSFEKWRDGEESYRQHTYDKALGYVDTQVKIVPDERPSVTNELAKRCMEEFSLYTIRPINSSRYEMYIYVGGIYVPSAQSYIHEFLSMVLKERYDRLLAEKVLEKLFPQTFIDAEEFFQEEGPQYLPVQNGILDMMSGKLFDFNPKHRFFNKLPVTYDPEAKYDNTLKHFSTILNEKDIPLMQELYGYLLFRDYRYEVAFMFYGVGGNGKSKTIEQMKFLLGDSNTTNISLQDLQNKHFMKAYLHKKLANLADDIGQSRLDETRVFKELTGHGMITADRKHTDPVTFTNYAKMIFSANTIPASADDSEGFWRRWIPIGFNVQFLTAQEYRLKEDNDTLLPRYRIADTEIITKLTTDSELSGVLNWAMEGFARLIKNNGFSNTKERKDVRNVMKRHSSSVIAFAQDRLKIMSVPEQYELHENVYRNYIEYCMSFTQAIRPEADLVFRRILQEEGVPLQRKRVSSGYELRWYFAKLV